MATIQVTSAQPLVNVQEALFTEAPVLAEEAPSGPLPQVVHQAICLLRLRRSQGFRAGLALPHHRPARGRTRLGGRARHGLFRIPAVLRLHLLRPVRVLEARRRVHIEL